MRLFYLFLLLGANLFCSKSIYGQDSGSKLFNAEVLHEISINFSQIDYWEQLTENYKNNLEFEDDIPYIIASVEIDGEFVDSVGIRFKGFTSFQDSTDKKPFKIDFNEFNSRKRYDGLRKLNLSPGFADPTMQRDFLSNHVLRKFGIAASRVSFTRLYINGAYWGLYNCIEQIDKEFLNNNFSNNEGNLFKNSGFSFLVWEGSSPEKYQPPFELKTNQQINDWSVFINLIDLINNASDERFRDEIDEVLDTKLYLKSMAADVVLNNWDSYILHGRNYYLYEDSISHQFSWIPWDYNLSLGAGGFSIVGAPCDIDVDFVGYTNNSTAVEFKNLSSYYTDVTYTWDFGDGNASNERSPNHEYAQNGIFNVCLTVSKNDNCKESNCKEVSTSSFVGDCNSLVNGHTDYPPNFIVQRVIESRPSCCEFWTGLCDNDYEKIERRYNGPVPINLKIDQIENNAILLKRLFEIPAYYTQYLNNICDLLSNVFLEESIFNLIDDNYQLTKDAIFEDPNFLYTTNQFMNAVGDSENILSLKYFIKERINALKLEIDSIHTCPDLMPIIPFQDVAINEIMASNDSLSGILDPQGQSADWIELYNNTMSTIDMSSNYLSDKKDNLIKWSFPEGTFIEAGEYLIVWADEDQSQDGLHSNFKLSKSGEGVYMSNRDGSIIDSITFGEQTTNVSFARRPNGTGPFNFQEPTFGFNNDGSSSTNDLINYYYVQTFPNPADRILNIEIQNSISDEFQLKIYSLTGQLIKTSQPKDSLFSIDISHIPSGIYFLSLHGNNDFKSISKISILH